MNKTLSIEETREDSIAAAISIARMHVIATDEVCTIFVCLSDYPCAHRKADVLGCEFCERIDIDQNGNVIREVVQ